MSDRPLASHVTFGTYGTRLHGDERGTVERKQNQWGDPIFGSNECWQRVEQKRMRFPAVHLTFEQRLHGEAAIVDVCNEFNWDYRIAALQDDHAHTLITANDDGKLVRRLLKRRLGQKLSERWPLPDEATWWAVGGSIKWVWEQRYFGAVYAYIERQRTTPKE